MTLETEFAPSNVFLTFDTLSVGPATASLGVLDTVGIGDNILTTFTTTLNSVPITDVSLLLDIKVNGVSVGVLTVINIGLLWTISAAGLSGTLSTLEPIEGDLTLVLNSPPALGELVTIEYLATASEWSSLSGIRENYRIFTNGDSGEAVITSDPQFHSVSVPVNIINPPLSLRYEPSDWSLRVPQTRSVAEYAPRNVKSSLLLPDYFNSLQDTFIDELHDSIIRLRNIRRWNVMDEDYLDVYLQTLGMFFKSEVFDEETRRRFIKELPAFLELSGTKFTFNYLSFVVGALFVATELWSNNYKDFIPKADIPVGFEDEYYPTNHVQLDFDADVFGAISTDLIIDIFYVLASTPLVLHTINQEVTANILTVNATAGGQYQTWYTAVELP